MVYFASWRLWPFDFMPVICLNCFGLLKKQLVIFAKTCENPKALSEYGASNLETEQNLRLINRLLSGIWFYHSIFQILCAPPLQCDESVHLDSAHRQ